MSGIVLAFAASVVAALLAYVGSVLQALEARRAPAEQSLRAALLWTLLRRRLWLLGTAMNVVAFAAQVVALSLASLAIVQPVFALGLVVLALVAVRKLGERLGRREYAGIGLIVAGLTGLALVAPRRDHLPLDGTGGGVLLGLLAALVAVLAALRALDRVGGLATSVGAGLAYAWVSFGGSLVGEAFLRRSWLWLAVWGVTTVGCAILAVLAEMTALRRWPVTRSKPVVFALQTVLPAVVSPYFAAAAFGAARSSAFAVSLAVVAVGSAAVGSSAAVAKAAG